MAILLDAQRLTVHRSEHRSGREIGSINISASLNRVCHLQAIYQFAAFFLRTLFAQVGNDLRTHSVEVIAELCMILIEDRTNFRISRIRNFAIHLGVKKRVRRHLALGCLGRDEHRTHARINRTLTRFTNRFRAVLIKIAKVQIRIV